MSTLEERFQQGTEIQTMLGAGEQGRVSVPGPRELAPDLRRMADEALFGVIWARPGLKTLYRELSTTSVLVVKERSNQLRAHIVNCLNLGMTPQQVIEVFMHLVFYGGLPPAFNAMGVAKEIFDQRGIQYTPELIYDPAEDPETLYQRGMAKRREIMGDAPPSPDGGPITDVEREFSRLIAEYMWGSVWTRPGLDMPSRSVCSLSALTALGHERQIRVHVRGALRVGFTQEQVVEILVQTSFYAGFPAARTAIDIANEVFREGPGAD